MLTHVLFLCLSHIITFVFVIVERFEEESMEKGWCCYASPVEGSPGLNNRLRKWNTPSSFPESFSQNDYMHIQLRNLATRIIMWAFNYAFEQLFCPPNSEMISLQMNFGKKKQFTPVSLTEKVLKLYVWFNFLNVAVLL